MKEAVALRRNRRAIHGHSLVCNSLALDLTVFGSLGTMKRRNGSFAGTVRKGLLPQASIPSRLI